MVSYLDEFLLAPLTSGGLNLDPEKIGVIVPYSAQRFLISTLIRQPKIKNPEALKQVKISSVDGFQGSEMDVIILGLTRANDLKQVGFVDDKKRFNVATTRAKKHLAVFCHAETFKYSNLAEFFNMHPVKEIVDKNFQEKLEIWEGSSLDVFDPTHR